jgi:hypothetical protein
MSTVTKLRGMVVMSLRMNGAERCVNFAAGRLSCNHNVFSIGSHRDPPTDDFEQRFSETANHKRWIADGGRCRVDAEATRGGAEKKNIRRPAADSNP